MRPAPRPTASAPSLSVLCLLRSQSEQAGFFTPSTRVTACQSCSRRGAEVARGKVAHALPSIRRCLATSSRREASVESSLLNLDFLRPSSDQGSSRFSALTSRNPPAPLGFPLENARPSRYASTDTRTLWKRPWKDKWRKQRPAFKSSDSPALPKFLDDAGATTFGRRNKVKGANELKLRCTEFDENGNATFTDGEFKKSELIAKVCPISLIFKSKD